MFRNLKDKLKKYAYREQFIPTFIGLFINPFYFGRRDLYLSVKNFSGEITGKTLDVGCGSKPYEKLFKTDVYTGMDIAVTGHEHQTSKIDVFYDGVNFPFPDGHFDSIVCFEVLELVFDHGIFLNEVNRVMKPGGSALFTVPFMWDESEPPYDYARYTSYGLKYLFEKHGFVVVKSKKFVNDLRLLSLLTNVYIYKVIRRYIPSKLSYAIILPITTVFNIVGHLFYLLPRNNDMYFGNIFLLKKQTQEG